jgi:benzodiazapine receptor
MKIKNIIYVAISIIIAQLAGIIGSVFTIESVNTWYLTLVKPALNPPSWVFGPVWTTLYFLMGISAYLVWRRGIKRYDVKIALSIYALQLVLNTLWSIVFFAFENPGLALVNIVFLWLSILLTVITFAKISKTAAWLLVPYVAWVSFATYLNYAIWSLN